MGKVALINEGWSWKLETAPEIEVQRKEEGGSAMKEAAAGVVRWEKFLPRMVHFCFL